MLSAPENRKFETHFPGFRFKLIRCALLPVIWKNSVVCSTHERTIRSRCADSPALRANFVPAGTFPYMCLGESDEFKETSQ